MFIWILSRMNHFFFFLVELHFYLGIWQTSKKKIYIYKHVTLKTINGKVTSDQNFSFHVKIWLLENFHLPLWDWQIFLYLKTFYE